MKISVIEIKEKGKAVLLSDPRPERNWCEDGVIRLLSVEAAAKDEPVQLLDTLHSKGELIAEQITGDNLFDWLEQDVFFVKANALPTAWLNGEEWYHLVVLPETIVTVYIRKFPQLEQFIKRWWLDRPGPDNSMNAVMSHFVKAFIDEEVLYFNRIRIEIRKHAVGLKQGDARYTIEHLEGLMSKCHHNDDCFLWISDFS